MRKITNISISLDEGLAIQQDIQPDLSSKTLARILGVDKAYLQRRSIDARKKSNVHFVINALAPQSSNNAAFEECTPVLPIEEREVPAQKFLCSGTERDMHGSALASDEEAVRPIVVGAGPAGLFAALELAEAGFCPVLIERGAPIDKRRADVEKFHATRILNIASNVQFGEGGAGTFSDGKLTCGKNSPLTNKVLRSFVAAGAPLEISWNAKPHIGTDILGGVVKRIRARIIACGGEVLFHSKVVDVRFSPCADGVHRKLEAIEIEYFSEESNAGAGAGTGARVDGSNKVKKRTWRKAHNVIFAVGHSARDTMLLLKERGFALEQKPFSIGLRIEHEQAAINAAQFGRAARHEALGAADYKLNVHLNNGRGVYTFCMCPGGELVAAASEDGLLCINGMSNFARNGKNANAALLCSVTLQDFADASDPLSGIEFQRRWERAAFELGGGNWAAPSSSVGAFLNASTLEQSAAGTSTSANITNTLSSTYPLGTTEADLALCLPRFAAQSLREALPLLDRKLHGFANPRARLTGIESRSSSPVRILRDAQTLQSTNTLGFYPCGEGAGYAGGIMSAAIDGIRCAQALIAKYQ